MKDNNFVTLSGRLGKDPEFKRTESGRAVVKFRMATDDSYTTTTGEKVEQTDWHTVIAWGKKAELIHDTMSKGEKIRIFGKIKYNQWERPDGGYAREAFVQVSSFDKAAKLQRREHFPPEPGKPPATTDEEWQKTITEGITDFKTQDADEATDSSANADDLPF